MITRKFGRTEDSVSVVGQGTWHLGTDPARRDAEIAALRLGIELGLTHIDTAEVYGKGESERVVGAAVSYALRSDVFIASKVMPHHAGYDGILKSCEASLKRLDLDYLDLYILHWYKGGIVPETMRAMKTLIRRGLIRAIGVSNFNVEQLQEAQAALGDHPLACNQSLYNLHERAVEHAVLPYCRTNGIAFVGYSPLADGKLDGLQDIAHRHGATPHQIALNALVKPAGNNVFTLSATINPTHIRQNAAALDFDLSLGSIVAIDALYPLSSAPYVHQMKRR